MANFPERIGDYTIVREIGRGATAVVYLAHGPQHPDPVALKYVSFVDKARDEARWNRRLLKLLRAEEGLARKLNHPNIIKIYETVIAQDFAYVVMEYFAGQSLEQYCSYEKLLPVHRVTSIVFKCCMALDYAYRQGIVHRDIKPANVLVDANDNVKITDFGLAINVHKKSDVDSTFITGVGSPAYMSPEQIKNYPLNQKTDLYSLGVMLFHLLTGRLPFRAKNPGQLVYKIINADPPSASALNPDVPEAMDAVIRRALEKDLYSRYANGADFAKDLSGIQFKICEEDMQLPDRSRFGMIRRLPFFTEFEDIEIWEVARFSSWRVVDELSQLVREGSTDQRFGIILEGEVELSIEGKSVTTLGVGEVFGETAYLDAVNRRQDVSAVSRSVVRYLEVTPAALSLASEECREHFRERLVGSLIRRLARAEATSAHHGAPALQAVNHMLSTGVELQLVDD